MRKRARELTRASTRAPQGAAAAPKAGKSAKPSWAAMAAAPKPMARPADQHLLPVIEEGAQHFFHRADFGRDPINQNIHVQTGDTICVSTPGGGGYEGALKRNPELVQKDVQRGYYTMRQAQDLFGVVFTSAGVVDNNATQKLRGQ